MIPSDAEIAAFQRDGAVCLRGVVSSAELEQLTRGVDRNLADPSELAIEATKPGEPGRFLEDFCNWQRIEEYEHYVRESSIAQVVGALMGSSFHALTLHRSDGSAQRRRVVSFRFMGDDATHAVRRWRTSPPFAGLADELADGNPMDHPLFPMLWRA